MVKDIGIFPSQKLPKNKKNREWAINCIDYVIGSLETDRSRFLEMETLYNLYNGIYDEKDLKHVTNPYKVEDGFPATPQNMNIIRPNVDLLIGEETTRPFNLLVSRTSQDAAVDAQNRAKQMLDQYVMAKIMADLSPEDAEKYQQGLDSGEIVPPEQIQKHISTKYKDVAEITAVNALGYLRKKLNLDHEFSKGWKDALIAGVEAYYIGILNGEPNLERVNPLYFSYDKSPDLEFIEDGGYACRKMRMSYTEIYDRLYDKLEEKDLNKIIDMVYAGKNGLNNQGDQIDPYWNFRNIDSMKDIVENGGGTLDLWHATWKSFKKIGYVTFQDEAGNVQQAIVSEDYAITGQEIDIEWDWIIEVWEGYKIGDDLYIGFKPIEYQHVSIDNPNSQKLPYTGVIYSNTNSLPKSLVAIMKPLQYFYIVLWYRLELALARDKGKIINMDITQIPKSMGVTTEQWLHYLSSVGVNFFNPYDEGWNVPGREGGKPSQFNQFSSEDLTMSNAIVGYIDLMSKVEQLADELSGVSRQRRGETTSSELVGNVRSSISQSAKISEPLYMQHGQAKKRSMKMLLDTSKEAWRESGKNYLNYIMDDTSRAYIDISDTFLHEDMDLFIVDSSREKEILESIRSLSQAAVQNGASLLDMAEMMLAENTTQLKLKLNDIEARRIQNEQAAAEAEQQAQMEQKQLLAQIEQQKIDQKNEELALTKYKIDMDNQTRIQVAQLNAYMKDAGADYDQSGIPDVLEIGAQAIERQKLQDETYDKEKKNRIKEKELSDKKDIEMSKMKNETALKEKQIELEREKLKAAIKLQDRKDANAMARERLKAKTALKNKTVGER